MTAGFGAADPRQKPAPRSTRAAPRAPSSRPSPRGRPGDPRPASRRYPRPNPASGEIPWENRRHAVDRRRDNLMASANLPEPPTPVGEQTAGSLIPGGGLRLRVAPPVESGCPSHRPPPGRRDAGHSHQRDRGACTRLRSGDSCPRASARPRTNGLWFVPASAARSQDGRSERRRAVLQAGQAVDQLSAVNEQGRPGLRMGTGCRGPA
jgi:hypothetical protein